MVPHRTLTIDQASESSVMKNMKVVLVVEDDAIQRMNAVGLVEDAGFAALEAASVDEALKVLESGADISVLFTDISTPGRTNGLELARYVSERYPAVQIIIVSGNAFAVDDPMPTGSTFFAKPYRNEHIVRALQRDVTLH